MHKVDGCHSRLCFLPVIDTFPKSCDYRSQLLIYIADKRELFIMRYFLNAGRGFASKGAKRNSQARGLWDNIYNYNFHPKTDGGRKKQSDLTQPCFTVSLLIDSRLDWLFTANIGFTAEATSVWSLHWKQNAESCLRQFEKSPQIYGFESELTHILIDYDW